ncbi:DUF2345 domain-containing protein [Azonexus sp. IMCC34842]|uniref:DUF2345 domain-containing protein n=1 Tax=Azonexus sp. IMCC34842 TaxID=3420950 RepID=UPI003D136F2B
MSHNFDEGHNQWVLDDSPGQLRTRLATSENAGQLSLGHLIHQAPESASRGAWRGSGFKLRSDAWLAVRAGEGILISATTRPNGQSTQLDVAETVAQLKAAEETAQALSDAASGQTALPLKANAEQTKFIKTIDPKQDGKFTGSIGGQPAQKGQPGSRELGEPTERFAEPIILNEAPCDIGMSTPASTLLYAGGHLHATVQQDLHIASAHTVATTVGAGASWFSHSGGIKSIAAAGSHTIQANTDQMEILADQSVTITSSNDEIHILAKEKIVLQAGQSSVTLEGSNITFACPGTFSVKGSGNAFVGPGNGAASLESLPEGKTSEAPHFIELNYHDESLQPVANAPYHLVFEDGTMKEGILDANGYARLEGVPNQSARVYYGEDPSAPTARVEMPANTFKSGSTTNEEAITNIECHLAEVDDYWTKQADSEQREVFADFNPSKQEADGENLWHYLSEAEQKALEAKLRGENS